MLGGHVGRTTREGIFQTTIKVGMFQYFMTYKIMNMVVGGIGGINYIAI